MKSIYFETKFSTPKKKRLQSCDASFKRTRWKIQVFLFSFVFCSNFIYLFLWTTTTKRGRRNSYLVDPASSICLSQRL